MMECDGCAAVPSIHGGRSGHREHGENSRRGHGTNEVRSCLNRIGGRGMDPRPTGSFQHQTGGFGTVPSLLSSRKISALSISRKKSLFCVSLRGKNRRGPVAKSMRPVEFYLHLQPSRCTVCYAVNSQCIMISITPHVLSDGELL
jgi:hypothetical protein